MAMKYQRGNVYLKGVKTKKWYGKFRVYYKGRDGQEVCQTKRVVLGPKSEMKKWEAEKKLEQITAIANGSGGRTPTTLLADDSVTFKWFVEERYFPMRRGRWRPATRKSTEFEIKRYLVGKFGAVPLRELDPFQLQIWLNKLAEKFSDTIVRHAYVNLRAILKMARKLKFLAENPAEDLQMPETREVKRPVISAEQICKLIDGVENLRDKALLCVGIFCATRASETFGFTWKSYLGDRLLVQSTAFEGEFYEGRVKTRGSKTTVPLPEDIRPVIEAWRAVCKDTSPDGLMFPTFGRGRRTGMVVPFHSKNFLRCKIAPIAEELGIPKRLVTFQVMRRTLGTDMQGYGSLKDTQMVLRHASIKTTADVYVQEIAESTVKAINARTKAVLAARKKENPPLTSKTGSNGLRNEARRPEEVLGRERAATVVEISRQADASHITGEDIKKKGGELALCGDAQNNLETQRAPTGSCLRIDAL